MLLNHRKHARKRQKTIQADPASSGRFFDGWRERLAQPAGTPTVGDPRTWLLARGWRKAGGLFSLSEIPGGT